MNSDDVFKIVLEKLRKAYTFIKNIRRERLADNYVVEDKIKVESDGDWRKDKNLNLVLDKITKDYNLIDKLGDGGFSNVYRIRDKKANIDFALKIMDTDYILRVMDKQNLNKNEKKKKIKKLKERFLNEVTICMEIKHPNIVAIKDADMAIDPNTEFEIPYAIIQYIEGKSMLEKFREGEIFDIKNIEKISKNVLSALNMIHKNNIIHRDVKPGNIIIKEKSGEAVLIDFGIAKNLLDDLDLTIEGETLGTSRYKSPEQYDDFKNMDNRGDIYSFGVVLYEMITGETPFTGTGAEIMCAHIKKPVPNILDKKPEAPPGYQKVIEKAMAKEVEDRYMTADDMLTDLINIKHKAR